MREENLAVMGFGLPFNDVLATALDEVAASS
jgi:hypothetical protein